MPFYKGIKDWFYRWCIRILRGIRDVAITFFVTFIPIGIAASQPWSEGNFNFSGILNNFFEYWENGEIILPILGLTGYSIISLVRKDHMGNVSKVLLIFLIIIVLIGGGLVSESNGFKDPLDMFIIKVGWILYFASALICIYLIATNETPVPKSREKQSIENASKILEKVQALRNQNGGKL